MLAKTRTWPRGFAEFRHRLNESRRGRSRRLFVTKIIAAVPPLFLFFSFIIFITSPRDLVSRCGSAKFSVVYVRLKFELAAGKIARRRYYYGVQRATESALDCTDPASEARLAPLILSLPSPLSAVDPGCQSRRRESRALYISFVLAHSGQMMSSPSVMKPRPTSEVWHIPQMKQSLCQCLSSNEMKRVPPIPAN